MYIHWEKKGPKNSVTRNFDNRVIMTDSYSDNNEDDDVVDNDETLRKQTTATAATLALP